MAVIVASFNVENMFRRPIAFNQSTWAQGKPILEAFSACQLLLQQPTYSNADKKAKFKHLKAFGLLKSDEGPTDGYPPAQPRPAGPVSEDRPRWR